MVQSGEMTLETFVAKQAAWMSKHIARCSGMTMTISGPASPAGAAPAWKKKRKGPPTKAKPKRAVKAKNT
jgi:DNA topoisomerase-3